MSEKHFCACTDASEPLSSTKSTREEIYSAAERYTASSLELFAKSHGDPTLGPLTMTHMAESQGPAKPLSDASKQTSISRSRPAATATTSHAEISARSEVPSGTFAGILVVCVLIAALTATIVTWVFMRRRVVVLSDSVVNEQELAHMGWFGRFIYPSIRAGSRFSRNKAMGTVESGSLNDLLPARTTDEAIKARITDMLNSFSRHVEESYVNEPKRVSHDSRIGLSKFDSSFLPAPIMDMLNGSRAPKSIILRALTEMIISAVTVQVNISETEPYYQRGSLLPTELAVLPLALMTTGQQRSVFAFFWWRILTAHLYKEIAGNQYSQRTWLTYVDKRRAHIIEMIGAFQNAFGPWRNPARSRNDEVVALENIMLNAVSIGMWLFGQRSGYTFKWDERVPAGQLRNGMLEVRPSLLKISDPEGRMLGTPKTVVARQTVRLGHGAL